MNADFWTMVARTRPADGDPSRHAEAITEALTGAGLDATLRFAEGFDRAMDALYRWDLWGAAYLAFGGCGDDAFEYFRAWLVGRGEADAGRARDDPEAFLLGLVGRLSELGVHDGEPLLYAAGLAHEALTGEWLPKRSAPHPDEPAGEPWQEDDLPERFPKLAAALPEGWGPSDDPDELEIGEFSEASEAVDEQVRMGLVAFGGGDHVAAEAYLGPVIDDPESWAHVDELFRVEAAYVVAAVRLQAGRPDDAAAALGRIEDRLDEAPPVRRALAQIELTRGELDRAARFLDEGPDAARMDRVLVAKLAFRQGRFDVARERAGRELVAPIEPDEHPWDVAGALYQVGTVLVELGDAAGSELAARGMGPLLAGAPGELPLFAHLELLVAGVTRIQGRPADALDRLATLVPTLEGAELAEGLREQARALAALGRADEARAAWSASVQAFAAAGERWDERATRAEMEGASPGP